MNPPPSIWFFVSHGFELAALIAGHTWCGDAGMSMWSPEPRQGIDNRSLPLGRLRSFRPRQFLDAQLIRG